MKRPITITVVALAVLAGAAFVVSAWVYMGWQRQIVQEGHADLLGTEPATLEQELRQALPMGSSRQAVEQELERRRLAFHFDPATTTVQSGARDLKGSNPLVDVGLGLSFHFDAVQHLTYIEVRSQRTGL